MIIMENKPNKITYKYMLIFTELHPNLSDIELYRYLYLCMKSMVVERNYDEIEKVLNDDNWFEQNMQTLKDFLIEEDFAHSVYKDSINKTVFMFLDKYRFNKLDYYDDFNELVELNNHNMQYEKDTTKDYLLSEVLTRRLTLPDCVKVMMNEECFKSMIAIDALTYAQFYIDGKELVLDSEDRKRAKIMRMLFNSSKNKIETDYQPIDNFPRELKRDE